MIFQILIKNIHIYLKLYINMKTGKNRIVVDYGGAEKLILLGAIHTSTGIEMPYNKMVEQYSTNLDIVKSYNNVTDFKTLKNFNKPNEEGYVIRFSNGFRMKIKFEEYCRLHSIVTNVSNIVIWEYLKENKSIDELLDRTPDEWDAFVKSTVEHLNGKFTTIEYIYKKFILDNELLSPKFNTRKEQAEIILSQKEYNSKILFNMLDGRDYSKIIWSIIRPKFAKPFINTDEDL